MIGHVLTISLLIVITVMGLRRFAILRQQYSISKLYAIESGKIKADDIDVLLFAIIMIITTANGETHTYKNIIEDYLKSPQDDKNSMLYIVLKIAYFMHEVGVNLYVTDLTEHIGNLYEALTHKFSNHGN